MCIRDRDTDCTIADIERDFGKKVAEQVDNMTWKKTESYMQYIKRVANTPAWIVKLADLQVNIKSTENFRDKVEGARQKAEMQNAIKLYVAKTILITGGTGTIGHALLDMLKSMDYPGKVIVTCSTGASALRIMREYYNMHNLRVRLGNVRDKDRYKEIMQDDKPQIVIHAAAMKRIDVCEAEPIEAQKTNIEGTRNLLQLSMKYGCQRFVFLSTDKAVEPRTWYGLTKAAGEYLTLLMDNRKHGFSTNAVRYGNVWGSNGSVIQRWEKEKKITLRNPEATRFFFLPNQAARAVWYAVCSPDTGRIVIPHMRSYRMGQIAEYYAALYNVDIERIPDITEKKHEKLYTQDEVFPLDVMDNQKANSSNNIDLYEGRI